MVFSCKKILFPTTFFLVAIHLGSTLDCYGCIASTKSDCFDGVTPSYFTQDCQVQPTRNTSLTTINPANLDIKNDEEIETVCIQFTENVGDQKIFARGCGYIYVGVDICEYLETLVDIEGCSYCREAYCNLLPGTLDP